MKPESRTLSRIKFLAVFVSMCLFVDLSIVTGYSEAAPLPVSPNELPALPSEAPKARRALPESPGDMSNPPGTPPPDYKPSARVSEITALRTENGRVFKNENGTNTAEISTRPVHYKKDGAWAPVDNRIVADETRPGTLRSAANSWIVRFAPLPGGIEIETDDGVFGLTPEGVSSVDPVVQQDGSSVVYPDAWPGIDLRYRVLSNEVKEELVVRGRQGKNSFTFGTSGADVEDDPGRSAGVKVSEPMGERLHLAAPEVLDKEGRTVDGARPALKTEKSDPANPRSRRLTLEVDNAWMASLDEAAFPIVIDPTLVIGPDDVEGYRSPDGWVYYDSDIRVGNSQYSGNSYIRTVVH